MSGGRRRTGTRKVGGGDAELQRVADENNLEYLGVWNGPNETWPWVPLFKKPSDALVTHIAGVFIRGDLVEGRFLPDSRDPNKVLLASVEDKLDPG